jgi:nucleotide-binding universal stress UspA family protein
MVLAGGAMFRKILVCSDLSPASNALINCVQEMKEIGVEEVILAHVIHVTNPLADHAKVAEDARAAITRQQTSLEEAGIRVTVVMPSGLPTHALVQTAKEADISGVVIGSHGKGILRAKALGSVSAAILHQAKHPVLLVRNELRDKRGDQAICEGTFSRILFPTDFSDIAERALDYLGKIAREANSSVTVLHVVGHRPHDPADVQRQEEAAQYLLQSKKRRLEALGAQDVAIDLLHGHPSEEILGYLRKGNFTMIFMGTHGKGLIKEVLMGSVASDVARYAAVPTMFVPAAA